MTYAYRGEDGPIGGKPGRTPGEVKKAGGFKPWKSDSIDTSRANLRQLVTNGTLAGQAELWCLGKKRENGWFFSSGLDAATAYDTYQYFYRFDTTGLVLQPWSVLGQGDVAKMKLYLDSNDLDMATKIAVIWSPRPKELLVMSPVEVPSIELRTQEKPEKWLELEKYTGP
ncbi:hypothetical protein GLA29479_5152 [Lysobacter antibioticus]|uniref:Uncharacterized protein n=1 Tax=Lysobacter antibioticus TaxID=84531 RepID=A0A0S2F5L8_LYSAN|nr:hypothetical protein [Lysobacter antibioticus]ALN65977.1 hypothetical protein GLA29479_5152 [Lysobacter antibioticus]ALN78800.1 hypothetical protein LA76x_0639 [Lysobacter antibioticus]